MVTGLKLLLGERLGEVLKKTSSHAIQDVSRLAWCVQVEASKELRSCGHFILPYNFLTACNIIHPERTSCLQEEAANLAKQISCDNYLLGVEAGKKEMKMSVDSEYFAKKVLKAIVSEKQKYGLVGCKHEFHYSHGEILPMPHTQKVVVEYSSPNIAKPFHAGHLRSTILGNFVANINKALGNYVVRINYLGDWGTQFGLLGIGMQKFGGSAEDEEYSMYNLYKAYVKINKEYRQDETIQKQALDFFRKMEQGDPDVLSFWEKCRSNSISEYSKVYKRLGIEFDLYDSESQYRQPAQDIIQTVKQKGLMKYHDSGVGFMNLASSPDDHLYTNLVKSDGTSLYITRDIAAAIDRFKKYNFDRIHYVVENGQHLHFQQLLQSLRKLGEDWAERLDIKEFHVKFGRVEGMSTRRGEVVFLEDILDEAKARMIENMKNTQTTRVSKRNMEDVADRLGASAVIVQDLKDKRLRNYTFNWHRMLQFRGYTGVFLQYTHARLFSLEENCGVELDTQCSVKYLLEPEALKLIQHLARFEEEIHRSYCDLEPCYIVKYLFHLCHLVGSAHDKLRVKGEPSDIAQGRLLLFHCARITLSNGLKLIGIEPVERM